MKIYFAASVRGGRDRAQIYPDIVSFLEEEGHEVLSSILAKQDINENEGTDPTKGTSYIYQRDIDWLNAANLVVAEVTQPSLGVGYEIAKGEELGKRIICLYDSNANGELSAMISGSPKTKIIYYENIDDLKPQLRELL